MAVIDGQEKHRLSFKKDVAIERGRAENLRRACGESEEREKAWHRRHQVGLRPAISVRALPAAAARRFSGTSRKSELAFVSKFKKGELSVDKGATMLVEGSHSAHLYTVLFGLGFRYKLLADGRRQILNYLLPGDLIGLQGSLMGEMQHSVEALSPMLLCVFEREQLHTLYRNHPGLAFDITWIASREEQMLDENLLSIGRRTALERAAYLICLHLGARRQGQSGRQGQRAAADHPAACRRHARPVAGPHQQDAAQADRPQADRLARRRLRGARPRGADEGRRAGRVCGKRCARWSDAVAAEAQRARDGSSQSAPGTMLRTMA